MTDIAKRTYPPNQWETPNSDDRRFAKAYRALWQDPRFKALSLEARVLYELMLIECIGRKEFTFPLSTATSYGIHKSTFYTKVNELVEAGFIHKQSGQNTRQPNIYRFTPENWRNQKPP